MMMRGFVGLVMALVMFCGCGYTTGNLLPSNYRKIAIEPFQNKVAYLNENERELYVPLLETKAHDAIVSRFQIDGHLKIARPEQADLILKGNLVAFDRDDIRLSDAQTVDQYRIRVTVALTMIDAATGKVLWSEPSFAGETDYFTTGSQAKSEDAALQDALTDLGRRVVERTLEDW